MAYTPVRPTDPLDNPSHSGLHNQHSQDIDEINATQAEQDDKITALETLNETLAGGNAGEVLGKSTNDDYDWEWIPAPSGGDGEGDTYPGISTEQPNGLGIGTDGGLQVDPATLLSDADGQHLTLDDDGKIYSKDLTDELAAKLPYSYGTATPSTTTDGFLWYDENDTPPTPKFWDGAAFQNVAPAGGLELVDAGSFTSVSAININGCFSATYDNYQIFFTVDTFSSNDYLQARLRTGGSDVTSNYTGQRITNEGTSIFHIDTPTNAFSVTWNNSTSKSVVACSVFDPFASLQTGCLVQGFDSFESLHLAGQKNTNATSYDSISFFSVSGNSMTGKYRIYGLKD